MKHHDQVIAAIGLGRPFTGAWIETLIPYPLGACRAVAPSRGRGLKQGLHSHLPDPGGRPFTGAWIETLACQVTNALRRASPLHGGVD